MDWMFSNCSATAQRGALDWSPKFKKAVMPVFKELYKRVKTGKEAERVIRACGGEELPAAARRRSSSAIGDSEMWRAGKAVRALRPKEKAKAVDRKTRGVGGRGY